MLRAYDRCVIAEIVRDSIFRQCRFVAARFRYGVLVC